MNRQQSPRLPGLFIAPCGAWVHLYRFRSGGLWFKPLIGATRTGVLGNARA